MPSRLGSEELYNVRIPTARNYTPDTLELLRNSTANSLTMQREQGDVMANAARERGQALIGAIKEVPKIREQNRENQRKQEENERQNRKLASEEAIARDQADIRKKQGEQLDLETAAKRADMDFANQEVAPGVTRRQREADLKDQEAALNRKKIQAEIASINAKANEVKTPDIKANQYSANNFGKRLQAAERDFAALEAAGYDRTSNEAAAESALPDALNSLKSATSQQQRQAERNFLSAVLRRESGASISPTEYAEGEAKYFPRHGDKPEVLAQKKRAREMEIANLRAEAGAAWGPDTPAQTGGSVTPMPQPNAQEQVALDWARANPSDKRAAEIMAKVGPKYGIRP